MTHGGWIGRRARCWGAWHETWHELATRAVTICRDAGALAVLPNALTYRASPHVLAGEFAAASALIDEAYAIAEATGSAPCGIRRSCSPLGAGRRPRRWM